MVPGGRARPLGASGANGYRSPKSFSRWLTVIFASWLTLVAAVAAGAFTPVGQDIAAALMRFLLFYGGVFALIALSASVAAGLIATDRIIVTPGGRILAQGIHRALSFGAIAFLIVHIVTEVAAGRSQPVDSIIPFLDHGRRFYLGLGTVAGDLLIMVAITGVVRARFATWNRRWAWRAIHAAAYVAWIFGIVHGLLAGRQAHPYVDWSYGACVGAVAIALVLRVVVTARVRETAATAVAPSLPLASSSAGALMAGGMQPGAPYPPAMLGQAPGMVPPAGSIVPPARPDVPARPMLAPPPRYQQAEPGQPEYQQPPYLDHDDRPSVRWAG